MEPIFYVMAIMGCGDGSAHCREARDRAGALRSPPPSARRRCPRRSTRNTDLDFPVIAATCRASGAHGRGRSRRRPAS